MNRVWNILRRAGQPTFVPALAAVVAATAGCSVSDLQDDGQPEPTLAEYRINVTPSLLTLDNDVPGVITQKVSLTVSCNGKNLPNCDTHNPNWRALEIAPGVSVVVDDPTSANTTATITVTPATFQPRTASQHSAFVLINFEPTPPTGLTVTGRRRVDLRINFRRPEGERKEIPAEEPRVKIAFQPHLVSSFQQPAISHAIVTYLGSPGDILNIFLSSTNASKFLLSAPPTPFGVEGASTFTFDLTFLGAPDTTPYAATVTVSAQSGTHFVQATHSIVAHSQ